MPSELPTEKELWVSLIVDSLNLISRPQSVITKGYWLTTGTIHTPLGMVPFLTALNDWLPTVGGTLLIRNIASDVREGTPGSVSILIEFPSLEAAVQTYEADRHQTLIAMRTPHSDLTPSITEGLPTGS